MSYIITGADSAGALSLKRESAAAAIKKALELMGDGCRDVSITAPDGRIYGHEEFDNSMPLRERKPARKVGRVQTTAYNRSPMGPVLGTSDPLATRAKRREWPRSSHSAY